MVLVNSRIATVLRKTSDWGQFWRANFGTCPASAGFLFVALRILCLTSTDGMEFCLSCDKVLEKGCLSYLERETHPVRKNEGLMDID